MSLLDAIAGSGTAPDNAIGFESIERAARLLLFTELNDEIVRQSEKWLRADLELQAIGLESIGQVEIQPVPDANFFEGEHQSVMEAPPEKFPNVTVMVFSAVPALAPQVDLDQLDTLSLTMAVETYCAIGPVLEAGMLDFETILERRIQRTTEAVAQVIRRSGTLYNTINPISSSPRGGILRSSWLRPEKSGKGPRYLIRGSRLQYTLQRLTAF